jgi:hypothetical protein
MSGLAKLLNTQTTAYIPHSKPLKIHIQTDALADKNFTLREQMKLQWFIWRLDGATPGLPLTNRPNLPPAACVHDNISP